MNDLINRSKLSVYETVEYDEDGCIFTIIKKIRGTPDVKIEKEIRDKAIEEFAEKLKERCNSMISAEWNSEVAPISWADAYADFKDDIDEIAEQMKEVGDTKKILSEKAKGQNRKNRKFASNNPELPEVER